MISRTWSAAERADSSADSSRHIVRVPFQSAAPVQAADFIIKIYHRMMRLLIFDILHDLILMLYRL